MKTQDQRWHYFHAKEGLERKYPRKKCQWFDEFVSRRWKPCFEDQVGPDFVKGFKYRVKKEDLP